MESVDIFTDIPTLKHQIQQLNDQVNQLNEQIQHLNEQIQPPPRRSFIRRVISSVPIYIPVKLAWKALKYTVHLIL